MRSDDLAPLLNPRRPDPAGNITFRKGQVIAWNPTTAQNTVRVDGTDMTDLPTIASSTETLLIRPGDSVGILCIKSGGFSTWFILGRITRPGTPQAGSFMDLFGAESDDVDATESLTSSGYTDLATAGPTVTVDVGRTGQCLVWLSAAIGVGGNQHLAGFMSVASLSGPTAVTAADKESLSLFSALIDPLDSTSSAPVNMQASRLLKLEGLASGTYVLQAKYKAPNIGGASGVTFENRNLTALPL